MGAVPRHAFLNITEASGRALVHGHATSQSATDFLQTREHIQVGDLDQGWLYAFLAESRSLS